MIFDLDLQYTDISLFFNKTCQITKSILNNFFKEFIDFNCFYNMEKSEFDNSVQICHYDEEVLMF